MTKPIFISEIHRDGSDAFIRIVSFARDADGNSIRTVVSEYETASRGATASARREIARLQTEA